MDAAVKQGGAMPAVTLFAWSFPAVFQNNVVDHTWVTTYDNRTTAYASIADVVSANEGYWFSWGAYHPAGGTPTAPDGLIARAMASLAHARCLCAPNLDSGSNLAARGTIYQYGIDGVCHQLSNQILWATGVGTSPPQTVHAARGYWFSTLIFQTYGLQHSAWAEQQSQCAKSTGGMSMNSQTPSVDDFEFHLRSALQGQHAEDKIRALLQRREAFAKEIRAMRATALTSAAPSAADLNRKYTLFLKEAASILGEEDFVRVFDASPQDSMNIVDPEIYGHVVGHVPYR